MLQNLCFAAAKIVIIFITQLIYYQIKKFGYQGLNMYSNFEIMIRLQNLQLKSKNQKTHSELNLILYYSGIYVLLPILIASPSP